MDAGVVKRPRVGRHGQTADLVSVEDIPGISGPTRNGSSLSINTRNGDDRIGVFVQDHMTVNLEAGTGANQVEFTRAPHSESVQLSTGALTAFPTGPGIHFPNFQINYKASFGGSFKAVVLSAQGDVLVIGSSAPVFITGGPGADNFSLSAFGANLGAVLGSYVTIDGLGGANSLTISETDAQTGDVVTVLPTQILGEGPQPFVVNYSATGGSFAFDWALASQREALVGELFDRLVADRYQNLRTLWAKLRAAEAAATAKGDRQALQALAEARTALTFVPVSARDAGDPLILAAFRQRRASGATETRVTGTEANWRRQIDEARTRAAAILERLAP